jgi:cytochrome P450
MTTTKQELKDLTMADPEVAKCPFPYYEKMLREDPVHRDPGLGFWWVNKRADVLAGLKDWQHFTSDHGFQQRRTWGPKAQKVYDDNQIGVIGTLVQSDPPRHDDYRAVGITVFTPQRVGEVTPQIEAITHELIDAFIDHGEIDFVQGFSALLPATLICDEYGFPRADRERFKFWTDAIVLSMQPGTSEDDEVGYAERIVQLFRYLENYINLAASNPSARVIYNIATMNKKDGTPFTMLERIWMAITVFFGGNETTMNMLSTGIYRLAQDPQMQHMLRTEPEKISQFVEELLRFEGSVQAIVRVASEDTEFGGKTIPAGAPVIFCSGAADRDPAYWPDPDTFKLGRPNARSHLAFGAGRHVCVGLHVARAELNIAFRILLARLGNIRLKDPQMSDPYLPLPYFHAIASLPICFDRL